MVVTSTITLALILRMVGSKSLGGIGGNLDNLIYEKD